MEVYLTKLATAFVLPPGLNLALGAIGLVLWRTGRRGGLSLLVLAVAGLYLLATPAVSRGLAAGLQTYPPVVPSAMGGAGAVVVLGGGRAGAPEYGGETVSRTTLARVRYGARLHRESGLPILVAGGSVFGEPVSEAALMKQALETDFQVPVRWTEEASRNTAENARASAAMLARAGVSRVVLVTDALHMRRAVAAFERAGLAVVPAPTGFVGAPSPGRGALEWLPVAASLALSAHALHEQVGRLWYAVRY